MVRSRLKKSNFNLITVSKSQILLIWDEKVVKSKRYTQNSFKIHFWNGITVVQTGCQSSESVTFFIYFFKSFPKLSKSSKSDHNWPIGQASKNSGASTSSKDYAIVRYPLRNHEKKDILAIFNSGRCSMPQNDPANNLEWNPIIMHACTPMLWPQITLSGVSGPRRMNDRAAVLSHHHHACLQLSTL